MHLTALRFDKQLIIAAYAGGANDETTQCAEALRFRAKRRGMKSPIYNLHAPVVKQAGTYADVGRLLGSPLTDRSRIYLVGHGHWITATIAGINAADMAWMFGDAGLQHAKVVSIVSCKVGLGMSKEYAPTPASATSFAAAFHLALAAHGLRTVVYARVADVTTIIESDDEDYIGAKQVSVDDKLVDASDRHAAAMTKVEFYWMEGRQFKAWVT